MIGQKKDLTKLVKKTITDKNGVTRVVWVKKEDVKVSKKPAAKDDDKKDKKPKKASDNDGVRNYKAIKTEDLIKEATDKGISWKESTDPRINRMRVIMELKKVPNTVAADKSPKKPKEDKPKEPEIQWKTKEEAKKFSSLDLDEKSLNMGRALGVLPTDNASKELLAKYYKGETMLAVPSNKARYEYFRVSNSSSMEARYTGTAIELVAQVIEPSPDPNLSNGFADFIIRGSVFGLDELLNNDQELMDFIEKEYPESKNRAFMGECVDLLERATVMKKQEAVVGLAKELVGEDSEVAKVAEQAFDLGFTYNSIISSFLSQFTPSEGALPTAGKITIQQKDVISAMKRDKIRVEGLLKDLDDRYKNTPQTITTEIKLYRLTKERTQEYLNQLDTTIAELKAIPEKNWFSAEYDDKGNLVNLDEGGLGKASNTFRAYSKYLKLSSSTDPRVIKDLSYLRGTYQFLSNSSIHNQSRRKAVELVHRLKKVKAYDQELMQEALSFITAHTAYISNDSRLGEKAKFLFRTESPESYWKDIRCSISQVTDLKILESIKNNVEKSFNGEVHKFKYTIKNIYKIDSLDALADVKATIAEESAKPHKPSASSKYVNPVEATMFHGTSNDALLKILGETGNFRIPKSNEEVETGAMMGKGVYVTDCSSKAMQYCGEGFGRSERSGALFLCKVSTGDCKDYSAVSKARGTATVFGDKETTHLLNNEWCVKEERRVAPEYFVDIEIS